ncbi:MAG: aldehyde dehydrogenase family protein [Actinomycetia bacterium]|nr:aldehyde dehydrogenase family protein [Actinomycetes bacterium]
MEQTVLPLGENVIVADASDDVLNPFDGSVVASVPSCNSGHVDEACAMAAGALERGLPQADRAQILERAASLLRKRVAEFASTVALEAGKPIRTANNEALRCADTLAFSAAEARHLAGEMVPLEASTSGAGRIGFTLAEPIGVVAAITPFNFPLNLVAHKIAPAIAAGCPVVLKPAELTPLSAIRLVGLLLEAGLPRDWITVVTGPGQTVGQALVEHPVPAMVTFTGSTSVGWSISAAAPRKKVSLELGSTAPLIVEPETDLALIASKVAVAGYSHAGQSCISTQRVIVHRAAMDSFVELLDREVAALVVGDPLDSATDVGPLITESAAGRVESWIDEAQAAGGSVLRGGARTSGVVSPAVVVDPPLDSRLWREEVFGPVVAVVAYGDFSEALDLANDTDLALQAGVWTTDVDKALSAVRALDFGGVLINEVPTFRADQQPYGGTKSAGNTREGPAYTVREMTKEKFVMFSG